MIENSGQTYISYNNGMRLFCQALKTQSVYTMAAVLIYSRKFIRMI